jgi:hypothetical protein
MAVRKELIIPSARPIVFAKIPRRRNPGKVAEFTSPLKNSPVRRDHMDYIENPL